ncbi:unnamed protein product [Lasius platythorax]|uniref:Uncharacterized protein n=1 Tax=Lasius platythorax TaxID=488582 RepID=A0AAV2N4C1_9HYME
MEAGRNIDGGPERTSLFSPIEEWKPECGGGIQIFANHSAEAGGEEWFGNPFSRDYRGPMWLWLADGSLPNRASPR